MIGITSTHVDDLKCTGEPKALDDLQKGLEAAFGKLKVEIGSFEHCGIKHFEQEDGSLTLSQDHYVTQLKRIPISASERASPDTVCSPSLHSQFRTLLGGLSWFTQTRADISCYVGSLQRAAHTPLHSHVIRCNRVLAWCRRTPLPTVFKRLKTPLRLVGVSDAAFKRVDPSGLVVRGSTTLLCSDNSWSVPGSDCHVLDFFCPRSRNEWPAVPLPLNFMALRTQLNMVRLSAWLCTRS